MAACGAAQSQRIQAASGLSQSLTARGVNAFSILEWPG